MIRNSAFARLIKLGRLRGGVMISDIRNAMPIHEMTAAEIADVVSRLENSGISVRLDPALRKPLTPSETSVPVETEAHCTKTSIFHSTGSRHLDRATTIDRATSVGIAIVYAFSSTFFIAILGIFLVVLALTAWRIV